MGIPQHTLNVLIYILLSRFTEHMCHQFCVCFCIKKNGYLLVIVVKGFMKMNYFEKKYHHRPTFMEEVNIF